MKYKNKIRITWLILQEFLNYLKEDNINLMLIVDKLMIPCYKVMDLLMIVKLSKILKKYINSKINHKLVSPNYLKIILLSLTKVKKGKEIMID